MYVVLANFILIELLRDVLKNCVLVVSLLVCYYDVCEELLAGRLCGGLCGGVAQEVLRGYALCGVVPGNSSMRIVFAKVS